ncbi:MLP-like protein 43 [Juglans microcarpa x Juglans regia]|uniref:MLP-like protein 43 n=1 Tax=Juglans microcarpa x Juglans regia TaxID=2249226 RepID=UPI001B7F2EB1|nr:MLP-like protein 43 [Juglans microcarpa x Juglans regia]
MSSSLSGKLSIEVEAKSSAPALYEANSKRFYEIPKLCPNFIQKVDLVEGNRENVGAVINWHFLFEGKTVNSQEILESIDDEKLSVTFKVIGGLLVEAYKSFKFVFQAIPKKQGCLARWTVEYEKLNEEIPDPKEMLQFAADLIKEMDDNLMIKRKEYL